MTDYSLYETTAFGGFTLSHGETSLKEESGLAIFAITIRTNGKRKFNNAFKKFYGKMPPESGQSITAGATIILSSALDQFFVVAKKNPLLLAEELHKVFSNSATICEQTDAWGILILDGEAAHATMERLSQVDLSPDAFPIGAVARTTLEHNSAIILRQKTKRFHQRFMLITPRSSAASFLHAISDTTPFVE